MNKIDDKKVNTSHICMNLTSSTGTWLNGCLQPQHYFVSMNLEDPDGKIIARVGLSYEQAARMLLYNGDVECTLLNYRDINGKLVEEKVEPPKTVHQRMKERLGETRLTLLKRIEDVRRDLYEMVNGDAKRNKGKIEELLQSVDVIKDHFAANEDFVVQQAEEELGQMQSNAAGQLGTFLQSKGVDVSIDVVKQMLPISNGQLLIGEAKPVEDDYEMKKRGAKSIDDMTAMQVADIMFNQLKRLELTQSDEVTESKKHLDLFHANASARHGEKVNVTYIAYQGTHALELDEAKDYLKFLLKVKSIDEFKTHWHYKS